MACTGSLICGRSRRSSTIIQTSREAGASRRCCPAITGRGYEELEGIKDGGMAMEAYMEAIDSGTSVERKAEIERELRAYCALDTRAMIRIWRFFSGGNETGRSKVPSGSP
jgi:hypothetical protein